MHTPLNYKKNEPFFMLMFNALKLLLSYGVCNEKYVYEVDINGKIRSLGCLGKLTLSWS